MHLWPRIAIAAALVVAVAVAFAARFLLKHTAEPVKYTQVTNFSDAVFSPAISPDGRMIAFIRGNSDFFPSSGEVYTKLLPNGEPVQLTHDGELKYGLAFSPDGSQITYTVADKDWYTMTVSALGGEPRKLLSNAAGLDYWLDEHLQLFSAKTWRAYGSRDRHRQPFGATRRLLAGARARDGALLLRFAGPQMAIGGGDGSNRSVAALPVASF